MNLNFKKVLLVVLDGFGIASNSPGNAVTAAGMETLEELIKNYPAVTLQAAGANVGLPWGEPGNSEVGHTSLGAGRIVLQDLPRINASLASGDFFKREAFLKAIRHVKQHNSALHLIGMLGEGGVHASQHHLHALLSLAAAEKLPRVFIHAITDGRDTPPASAKEFLFDLERKMVELRIGKIATLTGRFYAMDRARHWDLTALAYKAMVWGEGERAESPVQALEDYYQQGIYDETIPPTVIEHNGEVVGTIGMDDAVIVTNFRPDRALQLTLALLSPEQAGLEKNRPAPKNIFIATMTQYDENLPVAVAFPKIAVKHTLGEVLSAHHKKQLRISETEKFPHVTYFFNNGRRQPFEGEVWEQVKSHQQYQERYQNVPQMSAPELTQKLLSKLPEPIDFFVVNYANSDMVAHTGNFSASVKALQTIDKCLKLLSEYTLGHEELVMLITSDHGNIENVKESATGRTTKSHTANPVPFVIVGQGLKLTQQRKRGYLYLATQVPEGLLPDVAPTILDIFGIEKPSEMIGVSLLPKLLGQIK